METQETIAPFAKPLYVMAKPVGAHCNLKCRYCYYLDKAKIYGNNASHVMSDELLDLFTRQYLEAQTSTDVLFTWHGGEPLMRPLSFYKKAIDLQRRYGHGHRISNCIQTNGTLINDEWCRFFHDNGWLVGISIDGPQPVHDAYRRTSTGGPSFHRVMHAIKLLKQHEVEWNAMAVVNNLNAEHPFEFYNFFSEIGCQYLQFAPIVERNADGTLTDSSVSPRQWGAFLVALFDEWVRHDVGNIFVELFDCTLANWCGVPPGICAYAAECGHAGVMEHNGDVYSCDHLVFPEYRLGNIKEKTLTTLLYGEQQQRFSELKKQRLPRQCRECRYAFACHGECPKNRFVTDRYNEPGLNYLCQGYYNFYEHVSPYMDYMKNELDHQRPPANVMKLF